MSSSTLSPIDSAIDAPIDASGRPQGAGDGHDGSHSSDSSEYDPFAGPVIAGAVATTDPQREIWTAALVGEDASLAFNESVTLWMRGALDLTALESALAKVVERHESLRATFSGDGLTMLIAATGDVPFEVVDASSLDASAREAEWQSLLQREVSVPFDLTRGPLARVKVFRATAEEHRVVFTAHHIVCDGWSTAVVVSDWAAFYGAGIRGGDSRLAPAHPFSGYAREQAALAQRAEASSDEAFWVAMFADHVPILDLPGDRARPPLKTYASMRIDDALDDSLIRDVRRVSSAERASLFVTLLAAFEVLLSRLSGQEDLVVGIPAAGQSVGGHDSLVGHCVHMLPLRSRPISDRPFREFLAETRTVVLDAQEHQQFTFGKLLRSLPLTRDPSRSPLVSVVFNLDRGLSPDALDFAGLRTELSTNPRRFENFDLFLNAVELGGRVGLECQFNVDLFDSDTVRRWLAEYARLLRSICDNPAERIGWLRLLTDAEISLLDRWNAASEAAFDRQARVHDLIGRQVRRTPEAIAVEADDATLTYAELDARAEALACVLRDRGVGRGSLVGLCLERSSSLLVGLLGILKSGGAYVPLDPGYPVDRLVLMVRDSKMQVLVTEEKVHAELRLQVPHVVSMEEALRRAPASAGVESDATPEDPAYVIYTSGSTGVPKGAVVPHRAAVNLLESVRVTPGMDRTDAVLAVTTLSFDIAVSELVLPLVVGARIVLVTREVAADGQRLLSRLRESKATFLDATPSTWRLLLAAGWSGGEGLKAICTGEPLPPDLAGELLSRCASVWNGYGPTETTVWSTFWRVEPPARRILIGKPVANTRVYVLDARMQRVPIGAVGELYIGGVGVSLGYHDRPELTRERFVLEPFGSPGGRMYKTGDLVRFLPSGDLECLGRNDSQIKLRGYRIELGEIENALVRDPGVAQATVTVREDRPGDRRLVAYVVAAAGSAGPRDSELRAHLKKTLPDYMVPQNFVHLEAMPLLPNGKIDRRRLPAPQGAGSDEGEFVAPASDAEKRIAKLWEEILAVGRVGIHDDFFALGGHSLLASQFIARLKREHGVDLSFRRIFEAPTVAKLALALNDTASPRIDARTPLVAGVPGEPAPLTIGQRRIWLLEEMDPEQRAVHNLVASWRFDGPLNVDALQKSVDEITRRHAPLRTNIRIVDGDPMQVVDRGRTLAVRFVDLTALPEAEREGALAAERDATVALPFQLDADPLVRLILFRVAEGRHVLTIVEHNVVWDGWSFDVFLRELAQTYSAIVENRPPALAPLPVTYGDFARWQREWLSSADCSAQSAFWKERLSAPILPLQLPTDRPRKGTRSLAGGSEGIHLPVARAEGLSALARRHGATLFMIVFAAFQVLLHRRTGQRQLLVGTPMRARTQPEVEALIGLFVNTVALTTTVEPSMSFLDLVARVRETTLDAFSNQDVPLDTLGIRPPMLRALFSLQDATARPLRMGEVAISQEHALAPVAATEMTLWAMESRSSFLLMMNFASDLLDASTARRWLRELDTIFDEVQRAPEQPVGSIRILPAEELAIIETAGGRVRPCGETVVGLLQAIAAARSDAVALQCDGWSFTFGELLNWVAAVAHDLTARGVGHGSRVAVRLRSPARALVGMLAALAVDAELDFGERGPSFALDHLSEPGLRHEGPFTPSSSPGSVAFMHQGVPVSQGALAAALGSVAREVALSPGTVVRLAAPLENPVAFGSLLAPLLAGAGVVVASDDQAFRAALSSASTSAALIEGAAARLPEKSFPRKLIVFGQPSPQQYARLVREVPELIVVETSLDLGLPIGVRRAPGAGTMPRQGEAPSGVAQADVARPQTPSDVAPPDVAQPRGRPDVVRPLEGAKWRVIDAGVQVVPIGVPGVLQVDLGDGPVRTGARVQLREDGLFELLGRADGRIAIEGALVDPSAIARALEGHSSVREAWVKTCVDLTGEPRIVAFCVARPGASWTETELRSRVRGAVGDRLVPRVFVELDLLPRDVTGAVDEERLTSPYATAGGADYVAPRTEAEKYLAQVWQEALGVARIGTVDNFFDLGGHSLLCFRVVARIERERGIHLSPRLLLLNSLEQVAAQLGATADRPQDPVALVVPAGRSDGPAPATAEQGPAHPPPAGGLRQWLNRIVRR